MNESVQTSIWNMDESRLKVIAAMMEECSYYFATWDIENLFFSLYGLRREASGKLTIKEVESLSKDLDELNDLKVLCLQNRKSRDRLSAFWMKADEIYISMNRLMKEHGLYFREGKDPRKAVINN